MSPLRRLRFASCLSLPLVLALAAGSLSRAEPQELAPKEQKPARTDRHGDPLPPGAVARLGAARWRSPDAVQHLAFTPDGKIVLSLSDDELSRWDAATGRLLSTSVLAFYGPGAFLRSPEAV